MFYVDVKIPNSVSREWNNFTMTRKGVSYKTFSIFHLSVSVFMKVGVWLGFLHLIVGSSHPQPGAN